MSEKKATIRDVASAANVSIATISRVLNKSPIPSDEMRSHVQGVMQKLNYVPQRPGRKRSDGAGRPRKRRAPASRTIGLLLAAKIFNGYSEGDLYYARLLSGIYQWFGRFGYNLMVGTQEDSNTLPSLVTKNALDGLIIDDQVPAQVQQLLMERMPVVFIDSSPRKVGSSSIRPNFETAMTDILTYLWNLGHREIAMFIPEDDPISNPPTISAYERFFAEKGYQPRIAALNRPRPIQPETHLAALMQYAKDVLNSSPRPTAIIGGDTYVCRINIELTKSGLRIPEDISLVGIDDTPAAVQSEPPLTSYQFPMDEIGKASVEELLQKIADPSRAPRQIFLDGKIIFRESVAAIPAE